MSRGPLEVLAVLRRDAAHAEAYRLAHEYADGTLAEAVNESCEAIAQVEALARHADAYRSAADLLNAAMSDGINVQGAISGIVGARDNLNAALAPFTPGQDSEGGGNG